MIKIRNHFSVFERTEDVTFIGQAPSTLSNGCTNHVTCFMPSSTFRTRVIFLGLQIERMMKPNWPHCDQCGGRRSPESEELVALACIKCLTSANVMLYSCCRGARRDCGIAFRFFMKKIVKLAEIACTVNCVYIESVPSVVRKVL